MPKNTKPPQLKSSRIQTVSVKKSKKLALVVVMAIVVGLAGILGIKTFHSFNNKPAKVLADAVTNTLSDLGSQNTKSSISELEYSLGGDRPFTFRATSIGSSSWQKTQVKARLAFLVAGKTFTANAELRAVGDKELYIKLSNLQPTLDGLAQTIPEVNSYKTVVHPLVSKIDNTWIKLTQDDLGAIIKTKEPTIQACTKALESFTLSAADTKQLQRLFQAQKPIEVVEQLPSQLVDTEKSFHYNVRINASKSQSFIAELSKLSSFTELANSCRQKSGLVDERQITVGPELTKTTAAQPDFELWVSEKTRRPTKLKIKFNNSAFVAKFTTNTKFNSNITEVVIPKGAVPITQLQTEIQALNP